MHSRAFEITLLEDIVVSRRAATLGGHESLDYIPGQALLGACATRLYQDLSGCGDLAYRVFHSGQVRFGNGLPLDPDGLIGWPMPLSLHCLKDEAQSLGDPMDAERIYNSPCRETPKGKQPKQLRDGYLSPTGSRISPERALRMKTAISPFGTKTAGRAAEAQLFGYQALARGQRFAGWVCAEDAGATGADDGIDAARFEQVTSALDGELLLGRSRSAEYGRARLQWHELAPPWLDADGTEITLWLIADMALVDDNGQPTLEPSPAHLGLGHLGGGIDWPGTFLRHRTHATWNGARRMPDLDRTLIQQGSIIRLRLERPLDDQAKRLLRAGLGLYREAGLGQVLLNPPFLADATPCFSKLPTLRVIPRAQAAAQSLDTEVARKDPPLVRWLLDRHGQRSGRDQAEQIARKLQADYADAVDRARRELGLPKDIPFGPSKAQWGSVMEAASQVASADDLHQRLFLGTNKAGAVVKPDAEGWQERLLPLPESKQTRKQGSAAGPDQPQGPITFAAWLRDWLNTHSRKLASQDQPANVLPRSVHRAAQLIRADLEGRRQ